MTSKSNIYAQFFLSFLTLAATNIYADDNNDLGMNIAFDRSKGNCLACHVIAGGESPGDIGPELSNMQQRYPDVQILRDRIWDETNYNPYTVMPPFGKHKILSEDEIDHVVRFIHSL